MCVEKTIKLWYIANGFKQFPWELSTGIISAVTKVFPGEIRVFLS